MCYTTAVLQCCSAADVVLLQCCSVTLLHSCCVAVLGGEAEVETLFLSLDPCHNDTRMSTSYQSMCETAGMACRYTQHRREAW